MASSSSSSETPSPTPPGQTREYAGFAQSGRIPFTVPATGEKSETQYWIWGDLASGKSPLICLHGGPGMLHNYILPIALIAEDYGFPVVMYDQIGCGQSTLFPHTKGDEKFWQPELFMAELDNLKSALGITTFDLLGQSWGGMLASQYAIEKQPQGLRKLIICNSPASMALWAKACNRLRAALPQEVQDMLVKHERENTMDSQEYDDATTVFYRRHLCRVWPFPKELQGTMDGMMKDPTVYHTMNGPSEFTVIGNIKSWTVEERLHTITPKTAPGGVLLVNGHHDEAQDEVMWPFFNKVQARVKWLRFAMSSHTPMLEETEAFIQALGEFLQAD